MVLCRAVSVLFYCSESFHFAEYVFRYSMYSCTTFLCILIFIYLGKVSWYIFMFTFIKIFQICFHFHYYHQWARMLVALPRSQRLVFQDIFVCLCHPGRMTCYIFEGFICIYLQMWCSVSFHELTVDGNIVMDWMCPPQIHMLSLCPSLGCIWRWASKEVIKVKWSHKSEMLLG